MGVTVMANTPQMIKIKCGGTGTTVLQSFPARTEMIKRTTPRILFLLPALLFAADSSGVRPRVDRSQYAVAIFNQALAVAAELVPAEKVRKQFGTEVESRYLVVEVGMFPKARDPLAIRPGDFVLRVNRTRDAISASFAKAVVQLSETLKPMAKEMEAKCLPETSTDKPVAGYLYFPVRDKQDGDNEYELEYKAQRTWMILPLRAGTPR